jgi:nicotinate-nucleotide pyrophosphorylase (carboxylating)
MAIAFAHADDLPKAASDNARAALAEDVGSGDISAQLIDRAQTASASVISRDSGIFCGAPWITEVCAQVDVSIKVNFEIADGDPIRANQSLFSLTGPARGLLTAERTVLNFVQLLSGTATQTDRYVALIADTPAKLLDTRKTVPGLRLAQKYAVCCGGGHNHRRGLFDAFLLKENHLAAAGGIAPAVAHARSLFADRATVVNVEVEVEVESLGELDQAISAGADIALIDNFSLADTRTAVAAAAGHIKLEASGGIDEKTITDIAHTGVDYISIGNITKQVIPLDLSMRFTD